MEHSPAGDADRNLRTEMLAARVAKPLPKAAGDDCKENVVDGGVGRARGADRLQVRQRCYREGQFARSRDGAVEGRA